MSRDLDQQMYFIVHLQNDKRVQKSQSTDIFSFVLEGVYANFYLTAAANSPSDEQGKGTREEQEGLQSNFYKACLSAGTLEHFAAEDPEETEKTMTFLADYMGAGIPLGKHPSRSKYPLVLAFLTAPLIQQTHFVLHIFCCFAITTRECNSS